MVIIFTKLLLEVVLPIILAIVLSFMPIFILVVGFSILLRAIGIRISLNSMVNAIFRAIGRIGRKIWRLFLVLVLKIANLLPKLFYWVRAYCRNKGLTPILSNIIASIVLIGIVAIII